MKTGNLSDRKNPSDAGNLYAYSLVGEFQKNAIGNEELKFLRKEEKGSVHRHTNTSSYFFILTLFSINNVNEKNFDQYDYMEYVKILEIDNGGGDW